MKDTKGGNMDIGVVRFLAERELGRSGIKLGVRESKVAKLGNICEQVIEDKATIPSKNLACEFSGQTRATFLMTFSPDGSKMASTHGDHNVRITDLASGKCLHTLKGHPRTPWCVAFHPVSNDILASGCLGGEVRIWDLRGGGSEVWRSEKSMSITSMAFHPSDQVLVFSVANEIHFWDWTEPEPFATASTTYEYEKVRWVRFDPHGYHLYTGIGNAVSVHMEEQPTTEQTRGSGSQQTSETRTNLQNQYWRILDEINQLRRDRLQNELSGGFTVRRPRLITPVVPSAEPGPFNVSTAPSGAARPTSPVHVDALVNARIYASAVTRAQQQGEQPTSSSQSVSQSPSVDTVTISRASRNIMPRVVHISRRVLQTSTASGQGTSVINAMDNEGANDETSTSSTSVSGTAAFSMSNEYQPRTASRLSTFLRSQLTSVANSSASLESTALTSTSTIQSLAQSLSSSTTPAPSNTIQPVTVIPVMTSQSSSISSASRRDPASVSSSGLSLRLASAFQAQSRAAAARTSSVPSSSTTSSVSSSESVRGRFMSYLNSRASSATSADHFHCAIGRCQVCQNHPPSMNRWTDHSPRTVPILPRRVSRSTDGQEGPSSRTKPCKHGSRKLAGLLESEVRQALDQVRARRSDISETLRDLGNLRQELDMHQCPGPSGPAHAPQTPQPGPSSEPTPSGVNINQTNNIDIDDDDDDDLLLSSQESVEMPEILRTTEPSDLDPQTSTSGNVVPETTDDITSIPDPMPLLSDHPESSVGEPESSVGESDSLDPDGSSQESSSSMSSLGSLDSLPSSQESQHGGESDPMLVAIGNYSLEIERRVHDLDQRISGIQSRLQLRLERLQKQREKQQQQTSQRLTQNSIPRCVSFSERIRQQHERLRGRLQDLRRRYQNRLQAVNRDVSDSGVRLSGSSNRCIRSPRRRRVASNLASIRENMRLSRHRQRERERSLHMLERRHLHPHYSVSILDDTVNRPDEGFQAAINRAIAGAFVATGENNVASNIVNASFRIQRWEFSRGNIPDIKNSNENIIVPQCKLHNDGYCDVSQDGRYLAAFVPSHRGFPDDSILAVFSLAPETFKQCLFTKSFGPNFVSVSISPLNNYLLVGLATRRLAWVFTPRQMVAQVYKMTVPEAGEESMEHVCDLMHPCDMDVRAPISVNSAKWLPYAGEGIVYGTNRGDLHICRPGFEQEEKRNSDGDNPQESHQMRPNWVMNILGMNTPRTTNTSTQTIQRVRRTASTQTDRVESEESA